MKKFITALSIIIGFVAIALSIYFGIDSRNSYNKGYNDGTGDLSAYEQVVNEYQSQISQYVIHIQELNNKLTSVTNQLNDVLTQSEIDQALISSLQTQISELQNSLQTANSQKAYYEELLEAYLEDDDNTFKAEFYIKDEIYDIKIVNSSVKVSFPILNMDSPYIFKGWSLDGETVIEDTSNYFIEQDTKFYAVIHFDIAYQNVYSYCKGNNYYVIEHASNMGFIDDVVFTQLGMVNSLSILKDINIFKNDIVSNYRLIVATPRDGIIEFGCDSIQYSTEQVLIDNESCLIETYTLTFSFEDRFVDITYKYLPNYNSFSSSDLEYNVCNFEGHNFINFGDNDVATMIFVRTSSPE